MKKNLLKCWSARLLMFAAAANLFQSTVLAAPAEVKLGLVTSLSGPWARQGQLMLKGAEMAVSEINAQGGIKALGGAKIRLVAVDAGDSTEKAKSAAQRLLAEHPDLAGGMGAWLSSFTLAITEVTERADLPWLTLSISDQITNRGFKHVYQTPLVASELAELALPAVVKLATAAGKMPKNVAIVTDNTSATTTFAKPMREGGFVKAGLNPVVDETYTPPLNDATRFVQKLRTTKPDFVVFLPSAVSDDKTFLEKMKEFNLHRGRIPLISMGSHLALPETLKVTDADLLEGTMTVVGNWAGKGNEALEKRFASVTSEPWMSQDSISTYADVFVFKEAIERAKSADKTKVDAALKTLDIKDGIAGLYAGNRVKFDDKGRRVGSSLMILQWQHGKPVIVYPPEAAQATPIWPKQ